MPPPLVDLVSDTATRPSVGMLDAMRSAPLGDEQKGEDPTVSALEEEAAQLLGKECALFLPSATMANQIALALLCDPGDEVICHRSAHVFNYETGGTAITARAQTHPVDGERGIFDGDTILKHLRVDDPHLPRTRVVVVENTSNGGGGTVWPDAAYQSVAEVCDANAIALHIDGARLMNAAVKREVSPTHWTARAETVQMCFSKGLGCPFGAVLAMQKARWHRARRLKQALGGALRQAGVIAAAMRYGLEHNVALLADDHRRAQTFASAVAEHDVLTVEPAETNLVFFQVPATASVTAQSFCDAVRAHQDVRMAPAGPGRIRACFHLDVDDDGLQRAIDGVRAAVAQLF